MGDEVVAYSVVWMEKRRAAWRDMSEVGKMVVSTGV
jgi:hypothetical protein